MITATSSSTRQDMEHPIFIEPGDSFRRLYNRNSFQFRHNLKNHPLFELTRLVTLAERLLKEEGSGSVKWAGSNASFNMRWSEMPAKDRRESITKAIADLEKSGSWLLLYRVQTDPDYRALMNQIIQEVGQRAGVELEPQITWRDAYIFLASPFSVTPYHIDHESTFLFQIHGRREANIWDREDRSVLTEPEIEDYYAGNLSSAKYKEENQKKANTYDMIAGTGVHHPVLAPHAFKNGSEYSVALGVHFCLADWDRRAKVYQINACLRRMRLRPTPPGNSQWKDKAKIGMLGMISTRKPKNKYELLRSGFTRLTFPISLVPGLKRKFAK